MALLAERGAIRAAEFPRLASALARLKRSGALISPLPGVFVVAGELSGLTWMRAVSAWSAPRGAIHAGSAASIWLGTSGSGAELAHPSLRSRAGVEVCRRLVPPEFVTITSGIRMVSPGYAAVELAAVDEGRACCEALRRGLATPDELDAASASLRGSPGHSIRTPVVASAVANPWSFAELRLHRILASAGISDWVANRQIRVGGYAIVPDVRFRSVRLILEFDGRTAHSGAAQFLADRERQNLLEAAGYRVLRFGWEHLDQPEYIVAVVRAALRAT